MHLDKHAVEIAKKLCLKEGKNPDELVPGCYMYQDKEGHNDYYVFDDAEEKQNKGPKLNYLNTKVYRWREYYAEALDLLDIAKRSLKNE